jgi:hypothetical protein
MSITIAQDLFTKPEENVNPEKSINQNTETNTDSDSNAFSNFDLNKLLPTQEKLDLFIRHLNSFTLAWCLFYAALLYANFYYNRMLYPEGEVGKEKRGVSQIYRAAKIWWTYLICLGFLIIYKVFPVFSYLTILVYFYKLIHWDLVSILDIVDNYFGINEILKFFQRIFKPLKKLLSFKF